jgi:hypothetical protein
MFCSHLISTTSDLYIYFHLSFRAFVTDLSLSLSITNAQLLQTANAELALARTQLADAESRAAQKSEALDATAASLSRATTEAADLASALRVLQVR